MVKKHPQDLNGSTLNSSYFTLQGTEGKELVMVMTVVPRGTECRRHRTKTHSPAHMYLIHWPGLLYVYAKYQKDHDRMGRNEKKAALPRNGVNGKL